MVLCPPRTSTSSARARDRRDLDQIGAGLRAQAGVALDLPPPIVIFTGSMAGKAAAEKLWVSDRMRHIRYSLYCIKSHIGEVVKTYTSLTGKHFYGSNNPNSTLSTSKSLGLQVAGSRLAPRPP